MELMSGRILLREFGLGDAVAVHDFAGDASVTRFTDWGPNSPADTDQFLVEVRQHAVEVPRRAYELAVTLVDTGELIGSTALRVSDAERAHGTFGYVLHAAFWGRGLATEATRLLLNFGLDELGMRHLEATCDVDNLASARVLENLGLSRRTVITRHKFVRGNWRDSAVYVLDRPTDPQPLLSS
jgi:[ribosomal protein S5]-alanine N-acetyltransferase